MKFRHTNFMRLIYATLLALPFVAILSRVIYVQSNKNAYQSAEITQQQYSIEYQYETNEVNTLNDLVVGNIYHVEITNQNYRSGRFYSTNFYNIKSNTTSNIFIRDLNIDIQTDDYYIDLICYANGQIQWYKSNTDFSNSLPITQIYNLNDIDNISFDFVYITSGYFGEDYIDYISESNFLGKETILESEGYTLDNVFEYSVNKFIENNNFGKINLFQWTTDLFFDSNDVNNMYVGFINWYLNYTLLVSATYILFLVLMWFINYARRLLERGMNYDW